MQQILAKICRLRYILYYFWHDTAVFETVHFIHIIIYPWTTNLFHSIKSNLKYFYSGKFLSNWYLEMQNNSWFCCCCCFWFCWWYGLALFILSTGVRLRKQKYSFIPFTQLFATHFCIFVSTFAILEHYALAPLICIHINSLSISICMSPLH